MKPQQLFNTAPSWWIAFAYVRREAQERKGWLKSVRWWPSSMLIQSKTALVIMLISATENRWNAEDLCLNRQIVFLNTKFLYAFFVAEIVWRVFLVAVERKWWIFWVIYVVKNDKFVTLSIKETKFSIPCRCRAEMVDILVYLCRIEWQICDSLNKGNQK